MDECHALKGMKGQRERQRERVDLMAKTMKGNFVTRERRQLKFAKIGRDKNVIRSEVTLLVLGDAIFFKSIWAFSIM